MKKICVVLTSRPNYASIKSALRAIKKHPTLELQIVTAASALLDRFGSVSDLIEEDGFTISEKVMMMVEGETPETMAESTGLGLIKLSGVFGRLKPDIILTIGDRYETISTAIAAAYMNIRLAHTMGGEVTGTIDESVRHAITKLAHIHFPANEAAAERIIKMGERPETVFNVGCPRIDLAKEIKEGLVPKNIEAMLDTNGVGGDVPDLNAPFLLVAQYPVTTEYEDSRTQIENTLTAIKELDIPAVMLWPNPDAGAAEMSRAIRIFREKGGSDKIRFFKNFPPEHFLYLTHKCACMVGNSSTSIRDGAFLGTPAVNIGTRQASRDRAKNVIDATYNKSEIKSAILKQLGTKTYPQSFLYGEGNAGEKIAAVLSKVDVPIQKRLSY